MPFLHNKFMPRSTEDRKPWSSLWPLLLLLWWPVYFGVQAANEKAVASRQQTSVGLTGECARHGKGNDNYCHYSFGVGDDTYTGVSEAASNTRWGQSVVIYYDSQNPTSNALKSFSDQRRESEFRLFISGLALATIFTFALWYGPPRRNRPALNVPETTR